VRTYSVNIINNHNLVILQGYLLDSYFFINKTDTINCLTCGIYSLLKKSYINSLIGSSRGFKAYLQLHGLGYKTKIKQNNLFFQLGFTHDMV